jgi:hypothetical protein
VTVGGARYKVKPNGKNWIRFTIPRVAPFPRFFVCASDGVPVEILLSPNVFPLIIVVLIPFP